MSQIPVAELGLPPIDQVGYVVSDLDRSIEIFGAIFGEFQIMQQELKGTLYRGRETDVTLRMGFGRSGPVEIELIEVVSGESPHREMLERHGEGIHHIRFRVQDLDAPIEKLEALGFEVIWFHHLKPTPIRWAYLEPPAERGGPLIELLQLPSEFET
jgi:methylmalonyl-CoA/ethylmalonyl-CoA epimerase